MAMDSSIIQKAEAKPRTAVMEARLDIRTVATILRYFNSKGIFPHTRSLLLRLIAEGYADALVRNNLSEYFTSTADALNYLKAQGLPVGEVGKRGTYNLVKQLEQEDITLDRADAPEHLGDSDKEIFAKALEALESDSKVPVAKRGIIPSNVKVVEDGDEG
jgi:hypothetical protein